MTDDEQRIRDLLVRQGVSLGDATTPDPVTAAAAAASAAGAQPQPARAAASTGDDWWDALYAAEQPASPVPGEEAVQPKPRLRAVRSRIPDWRSGEYADLTPDPTEDEEQDTGEEMQPDADPEPGDDEERAPADEDAEPEPDEPTAQPQPRRSRWRMQPRTARTRPRSPRTAAAGPQALIDAPLAPRRSLLEAYDSIPPRIRWLTLHATAAAAGYRLGWVDYATRTTAWIADHDLTDHNALFWAAVTVGCVLLHRRAARTVLAVRWLAAVPISSIVAGTLLYGSGWNHLELPL